MSEETLFQEFLRMVVMSYFVFGLFLLLLRTPANNVYAPYRRSKLLLGLGYWVMACHVAWGTNMALAYLLYIIFNYAFCSLLDEHYLTRRRIFWDLFKWGCVAVVYALSMLDALASVRVWMMLGISLSQIEYILTFLYKFRKLYLYNDRVMDDYEADDKRMFVAWIHKYVLLMVICALLAVIAIYEGVVFNFCFQMYAFLLNLTLVIGFLNYVHTYGDMESAYQAWEKKEKTDLQPIWERHDANKALHSKLKVWLAEEKFTEQNVTLDTLALYVGTNRTYLSRFLNDMYGMGFSEWIATQRLSKAKELMRRMPGEKMENVAYMSGFSSLSYFSKVFSKAEGISPSRWRDDHVL